MLRILWILTSLVLSFSAQGNEISSLYQIDLIVVTHRYTFPYVSVPAKEHAYSSQAVSLSPFISQIESNEATYHLLPSSFSQLNEAWQVLSNDEDYQLLLHYSWTQSLSNQKPVVVENAQSSQWEVKGRVTVRKSNYYLFEADLFFSSLDENKTTFSLQQKQYLKGNNLYYLDHPQAGILIKIHPVLS